MMPKQDGFALVKRSGELVPELPIIASSGLHENVPSGELSQLGKAHLAQPATWWQLLISSAAC